MPVPAVIPAPAGYALPIRFVLPEAFRVAKFAVLTAPDGRMIQPVAIRTKLAQTANAYCMIVLQKPAAIIIIIAERRRMAVAER